MFYLLRVLLFGLSMSFATLLVTQSADYELEISDRLYTFEMIRLAHNHDRLLTFVYPELYTLIPREILREQMSLTNIEAVFPERLENFHLEQISEPLERDGRIFVRVTYSYWLPTKNKSQSDKSETTLCQDSSRTTKRNGVKRSLLAIRTDHDLQWYFLEIENGQREMLSAILPDAALKLK